MSRMPPEASAPLMDIQKASPGVCLKAVAISVIALMCSDDITAMQQRNEATLPPQASFCFHLAI